jgi:ATP-dependent helicase/nuclease subunit A
LVSDALSADGVTEPADDGDGEVLRYRKGEAPSVAPAKSAASGAARTIALPDWFVRAAPREQAGPRIVTPSSGEDDAARPAATGNAQALLRGALLHRLMQSLPDIPADRRARAAQDYLDRAGTGLPPGERDDIARQTIRVIEDARLAALYAPGSRAEVPIVGKLRFNGQTVLVSGQIDRLVVTQTSVLIGDFKTNRPPPRRPEDVPKAYVRQLALYRAVLSRLYPDRPVRAALIWTEAPDIMELSDEMLDHALTQITAAR